MQSTRTKQVVHNNERGMVSIMVTMILMIVMSLIVIGFAQISRRNQRVALDRQLSTQAFYAAESGINDARNRIKDVADSTTIPAKTSCTDDAGGFYSTLPSSNISSNVSYSCLLVNPTPTSLQYNDISTDGTIVPLISADGTAIQSLQLTWKSKTGASNPTNNCPATMTRPFVAAGNWQCGYGVLRFDLTEASGNKTASGYQAGTMTTFVVPLTSGVNTTSFAPGGKALVSTNCNDTNCTLTINSGLGSDKYYMRVSSLYQNASLTVTPRGPGGSAVQIANAQVVIDATGRAEDVLRRIQVHMPLNGLTSTNQLPDNALESTDAICKRFSAMDGWFDNTPGSVTGTNPLCQP